MIRPGNPLAGRDAVLLGLDGVLFKTDVIHREGFRQVLCPLGIEDFEYSGYAGMSTREIVTAELERNDIVTTAADLRRLVFEKREHCLKRTLMGVRVVEGAREFLADAFEAGYRIAVVTGGYHERVFAAIESARMDRWIDTVVTLRSGAQPKPSPGLYLEALRRLGVSADRAIAIEDAGIGVLAARSAGIETMAIVTGEVGRVATLPSDVPLTSFADLNEYLGRGEDQSRRSISSTIRSHAVPPP